MSSAATIFKPAAAAPISPPGYYPVSHEKEQHFTGPLGQDDIYQSLLKITRYVKNGLVHSTGFFAYEAGKPFFACSLHALENSGTEVQIVDKYIGKLLQLDSQKSQFAQAHDIQLLDCFTSKMESLEFESLPILPDQYNITVGMPVYFAGFPLQEQTLVFHQGYISSIEVERGARIFTIDGTVVQGHSGSPVAIKDGNRLYLIGMIKSVAMTFKEELEYLNNHTDPNVQTIGRVIRGNLSTGVGRVLDIRICRTLLSDQPLVDESTAYAKKLSAKDLEVGGRPAIEGTGVTTNGVRFSYYEWHPKNNSGSGPRGITIKFNGNEIIYKFKQNPHDIPEYNKGQRELYAEAAQAFSRNYTDPLPTQFSFRCYNEDFTAEKY